MLYIDLRPCQTSHSKVMHRKEVTHSDGSYERKLRRQAWLKRWNKLKIPWYTHRLMHRKRVTCELHDCYFRLMTIKHAITKIEWVIEWAIELLYNSVRQEVSELEIRRVGGKMWYGKPQPSRRGPQDPWWSWGPDELQTRCGRESQQKAEPPGLRLSIRRTRTTHEYVRRGWWGQYVAVFVRSPTLSHTQSERYIF